MTELVARARLTAPSRPALGGLSRRAEPHGLPRTWMVLVLGFLRAALLSLLLRLPARQFIGDVTFEGESIEYAAFVAPALLAASAMNGALYDATNVFWKLRTQGLRSILATPVAPEDVAVGRRLGALPRHPLLGCLPARDRLARPRRVPVGGARAARRASSSASPSLASVSRLLRGCARGRTST